MLVLINNQGQITPKWLVWTSQNSNSYEILCPSWLPASLTKIWSIMNVLAWRHHFPITVYDKFFQCSRARNTEMNNPIQLEYELIWYFMPVLDTCKFCEDQIKNDREKGGDTWVLLVAMTTTVLNQSSPKPNAALSHTPMMLHIKFDQEWPTDLRDIHVWKCKYMSNYSGAQGHVIPKWLTRSSRNLNLFQNFMPVLVTSKFDEDPIKNKRASLETAFSNYTSMGNFLDAQGYLIPKGGVRSGRNSNYSEILSLFSLPASLTTIGSKLKVLT